MSITNNTICILMENEDGMTVPVSVFIDTDTEEQQLNEKEKAYALVNEYL